MPSADQNIRTYQELAKCYDQLGDAPMRDRFWVMAADAMLGAGHKEDAERMRSHLLETSPYHLLKPFSSMADALKSADVKNYVESLRRKFPPETALQLLSSLTNPKAEKKPAKVLAKPFPEPVKQGDTPPPGLFKLKDDRPLPMKPAHAKQPPPMPPPIKLATPKASAQQNLKRPIPPIYKEPDSIPMGGNDWEDNPEGPAGSWVPILLFWVLLFTSLAGAGYTLARPFINF